MPWSAATMAYSPIRPKSQISNVGHDGNLSIRNFLLMLKELNNLYFEAFGGQWSIGLYYPTEIDAKQKNRNFSVSFQFHALDKANTILLVSIFVTYTTCDLYSSYLK
jgi:hypothetical protein